MADENAKLNPILTAMFDSNVDTDVSSSEPNERALIMRKLSERINSRDSNYIGVDEILEVTGQSAKELELELDSDNEIEISDLKTIYDANTKTTTFFSDFMENEATEQDYIDIVSGTYEDSFNWAFGTPQNKKALTDSKFNQPSTNKKTIDAIHAFNDSDKDVEHLHDAVLEHFNLDWDTMETAMQYGGFESDDAMSSLLKNPNVNDGHIYKMVERYPEKISDRINHTKINDRAREMFLDKGDNWKHLSSVEVKRLIEKDARSQDMGGSLHGDERDKNSSKFARQVLEHDKESIDAQNFDQIMGGIDEHERKGLFDKWLGIEEGSYDHTQPDESSDFDEENWDNWSEGGFAPENNKLKEYASKSAHLTDDQAEHIKRHGDFEERYALYHNKHVDTKHGIEMYKKWSESDLEHGYDGDELVEKFKEEKEDIFGFSDLSDEDQEQLTSSDKYYEHTDQVADESYTLENYMDDHKDSIITQMKGNGEINERLMEHVSDATMENYDDWTAESEAGTTNYGNPQYQVLDKMNTDFELESRTFTADDIDENSLKTLTELGLKPDEDGDFDGDEVIAELDKFGGPSQINYAEHDEFSIYDHPEFGERYGESMDGVYSDVLEGNIEQVRPYEISDSLSLYEDHQESTGYQDARAVAISEWKEDTSNFSDQLNDLYDNAHSDDRFIPDHVAEAIPEINEIRQKRIRDDRSSDIKSLPNRSHEHAYGENQHHHELLKDYADANGGKMDVGKMHKKFPNLKETWKKIFNGKGKLSSDDIQQKIDDIPKTNYDVTYGEWKSDRMQNINGRNQVIVRLDHSDESLKAIHDHEDPNVKEMFNKIQGVSKQSGHPTNDRTIAWAKVDTSDPEHWMIDEVQSDFGKTAQQYLKDQGHGDKANAIQTINDIHKDWRETITNHVIKTAKTHGTKKISTHTPESKASHTGSDTIHSVYKDSYSKVPKKMGFQSATHDTLPLTDQGRKEFTSDREEGKEHKGNTLDLTPEGLAKAIEIVIDLIKTEMKFGRIRKSMFDCAFDLAKGSRQRKMKFKPQRDVSEEEYGQVESWAYDVQNRESIPEMHPNAKKRAMQKLHGLTEVRTHPETGERMFLLHRGMSAEEHSVNSQGSKTSWTPHYEVADRFHRDAQRGHDDDGLGKQARLKSAWIPESKIHHVLPAIGEAESTFPTTKIAKPSKGVVHEHETIIHPHDFTYASDKHSKSDVHARIGERAKVASKYEKRMPEKGDEMRSKVESHKAKMLGRHNIENIPKLAASEVLNNDLGKGEIGQAAKGLVLAGAMALGAQEAYKPEPKAPMAQERSIASVKEPSQPDFKMKRNTLGAISDHHSKAVSGIERGSHHKESAYGRYGLSPITIKETIKANPDLSQKHGHLTNFKGQLFQSGMKAADKDGVLSDDIASKHYDKLAQHFENDPAKIAHAWKHGITRTKRADKYGININNNDHVKKIMNHYNKRIKR